MKHIFKITFLIFCISISACKKYEDGPAISLMSKKARLANIWKVDTYYLNGKDNTTAYRQIVTREKFTIFQSGNFDYSELANWSWAVPNYTGKWNFIDDKEGIVLTPDNPAVKAKTFKILRLKNKQLWLQEQVSPDSIVEYHYLPETGN